MLFVPLLRKVIRSGSLEVVDSAGRRHRISEDSPPGIVVRLTRPGLGYALAVNPKLSIGEAYADGSLVLEQGSVADLLALLARNVGNVGPAHWLNWPGRIGTLLRRGNPISRARRNAAHHYDLSPALYDLFLDADRQYSCAYFTGPGDSLDAAQTQKKRHIAAKLLLDRPGLRVLDVGSGWGGLALFLAAETGADVTGITLSAEQHRGSAARAAAAGMSDQVRFRLHDYRQERGVYDRIVSVGMFEHLGRGNYGTFFAKLHDLLHDNGVALVHSVGHSDEPGPINPFIRKHIFPGADVPSLSEVLKAVERSGLIVTDIEILRLHYAETLRHWRERFVANRAAVLRLYDERFFHMWEFYLALCEAGFRYRTSMVFQMQVAKRNDALPLTRDYMVDRERQATPRPEAWAHLQTASAQRP